MGAWRTSAARRDALTPSVGIVISAGFFLLCNTARLSQSRAGIRGPRRIAGQQGANDMAFRFAARRHMRLAVTLLALCCAAGARAEDAGAPSAAAAARGNNPSPSPAGQKGGAGREPPPLRRRRPNNIACRRIPRPGRRWRCPGARSTSPPPQARSACSTTRASRRPISPIPPTSSTAPIARSRPVTFLFNGGPGRVLGLAAVRRRRAVAAVDRRRWRGLVSDARSAAQCRDLARLHRSGLHRSRRHRLQPVRRVRRGCAQAVPFRRRRRQLDRAGDPALAGKIRPPAVAEIRRRRELWRHSRTEDRAQPADPAGRRRARADPGFAACSTSATSPARACCNTCTRCRAWRRWRAQAQGAGDARRSRRRRALCAEASFWPI